jgi:hypothetical protein
LAPLGGEGSHPVEAGRCWTQPPRIVHTVLGYSDDRELLEIVLLADFETVTLASAEQRAPGKRRSLR